jgi:quinol monooxygenase YgiN
MMASVLLHAVKPIKPERREEFLTYVQLLRQEAAAEEGTLSYDVSEDVLRPERFVFLEEYRDTDALQAHLGTEVVRKYLELLPTWLEAEATARVLTTEVADQFTVQPA